jgi:CheY-like chemotaxis protein
MNYTILVIEDDEDINELLTLQIQKCAKKINKLPDAERNNKIVSFNVINAFNGQEGMNRVAECAENGITLHGIFCDIRMPVMSGLEFLQAYKSSEFYSEDVPVIMCTAYKDSEIWESILNDKSKRIAFYYDKPVDQARLLRVLQLIVISGNREDFERTSRVFGFAFLEKHRQIDQHYREYLNSGEPVHAGPEERFDEDIPLDGDW